MCACRIQSQWTRWSFGLLAVMAHCVCRKVVPLPVEAMLALEGATTGGFMAKFQVCVCVRVSDALCHPRAKKDYPWELVTRSCE